MKDSFTRLADDLVLFSAIGIRQCGAVFLPQLGCTFIYSPTNLSATSCFSLFQEKNDANFHRECLYFVGSRLFVSYVCKLFQIKGEAVGDTRLNLDCVNWLRRCIRGPASI